jgi:hypothetical protein
MKTIFDKVDPKYIDCASGACEHAGHQYNMVTWVVVGILLLHAVILYTGSRQR